MSPLLHRKPPASCKDSRELGWVLEQVCGLGALGEGWGAPRGHGPGQVGGLGSVAAASCPRRQEGAGREAELPPC